jgi:tetratricopeptide (TPR) repeat protein
MYLALELARQLEAGDLSLNARALLRCRLAKLLERAGDYEGAREAMGELWQGVGARPLLEGLDNEARAMVILRVGALTGWLGDSMQIEGSQELAKDLISEAARGFEELGQMHKVGEARSDLALCYWRAGAFDEARVILDDALSHFGESDTELKAVALVRKAIVERSSTRLHDALDIYKQSADLFGEIADPLLAAHFHHGFANLLNQLSTTEHRQDYVDRALIEYSAASHYFEMAGHLSFQACTYINLGFLFFTLKKFSEAHEHLDRAQVLLTELKDNLHLAQVDETRARVLLAEGRIVEAEKTVRAAVHTLEKGENVLWLVEALTTHGIALAQLKHWDQARAVLNRAVQVAEQAGDFENAGMAALTIVEQVGQHLTTKETCEIIDHAGSLLERTQDISTLRRLAKAAFQGLFLTHSVPVPPDWTNFSLRKAVLRYEADLIKAALNDCDGSVTRAARLLGFNHHQSLSSLISGRQKELIETRRPVRVRRKSLIHHPRKRTKQT